MTAYPSLYADKRTAITPANNTTVQNTEGGDVIVNVLDSTIYYNIVLRHAYLTSSEKQSVDDHYAANAANTFDVVIAGDTYTVSYIAPPKWVPVGTSYNGEVKLAGVGA